MKNSSLKFFVTAAALSLTALSAKANMTSPLIFDNVDIRPVVEHFRKEILVVKDSFTLYNWSPAGPAYDSGAKNLAVYGARAFWQSYGANSGGNMYGRGLYGAADPATTLSYGGMQNQFLLTEMIIPVGFRMIDLPSGGKNAQSMTTEVRDILQKFDCSTYLSSSDSFFNYGGSTISVKCRELGRKVFKDILQIDGFAYNYDRSRMKACVGMDVLSDVYALHRRAFVITDEHWITPQTVRYYTTNTKDKIAERTLIMTYILAAQAAGVRPTIPANITAPIGDFLISHPDHQLKASATDCDDNACIIKVEFCDSQNQCEKINLEPIPRPGGATITAAEFQASQGSYFKFPWADLEGVPKAKTLGAWILSNGYVCSGKTPYAPSK